MENIEKLDFKVSIYAFYESEWYEHKIFVWLAPVIWFWSDLVCVDRSYITELMSRKFTWCDIYSEYTYTDCDWKMIEIYWVDGVNEYGWVELSIEYVDLYRYTWLKDIEWERIYEWDILEGNTIYMASWSAQDYFWVEPQCSWTVEELYIEKKKWEVCFMNGRYCIYDNRNSLNTAMSIWFWKERNDGLLWECSYWKNYESMISESWWIDEVKRLLSGLKIIWNKFNLN